MQPYPSTRPTNGASINGYNSNGNHANGNNNLYHQGSSFAQTGPVPAPYAATSNPQFQNTTPQYNQGNLPYTINTADTSMQYAPTAAYANGAPHSSMNGATPSLPSNAAPPQAMSTPEFNAMFQAYVSDLNEPNDQAAHGYMETNNGSEITPNSGSGSGPSPATNVTSNGTSKSTSTPSTGPVYNNRNAVEDRIDQLIGVRNEEADPSGPGLDALAEDVEGKTGLDNGEYELVGGWFDANDLPKIARDHL
jgi:hypothetical protein